MARRPRALFCTARKTLPTLPGVGPVADAPGSAAGAPGTKRRETPRAQRVPSRRTAGDGRSGAARGSPRRRPGRDHHLLRTWGEPRVPAVGGAAAVHHRPRALARPASTHGCRHRAGTYRPGTSAVRGAVGQCRAGRARGRQRRHDLCRIRRDRRGAELSASAATRAFLQRRSSCRHWYSVAASTALSISSCCCQLSSSPTSRCGGASAPGLGSRRPRPAGAEPASQQRSYRDHHRHRWRHARP